MRLIVLRHGPTAWNEQGLLQGRADPPLSEAGRQAVLAWRLPARWRALPCSTSPLRRARQTASALGMGHHRLVPELIEMDWGAFEGRSLAVLRAELGHEMVANEARGLDFRPPGGESPRDVMRRLAPWIAGLGADAGEHVVVTHKGVRRALLAMATGWDMRQRPPVKIGDDAAMLIDIMPADGLVLRETIELGGTA